MRPRILLTGAAGFIGAYAAARLAREGAEVVGLDNLNAYYSPRLKADRLRALCGIDADGIEYGETRRSATLPGLSLIRLDLADGPALDALCESLRPDVIINLAAQAGVRYSLEAPGEYVQSNVAGFTNILECARKYQPRHVIYASSSSVYGDNTSVPFRETDSVDLPASLYAATKRSNELFARVYAKLFGLNLTGLRFFTVYGPWGRPDMSPMLFARAMEQGKPIKVFNHGRMERDFTYIDDIIEALARIALTAPRGGNRVYNIGHGEPVGLMDYIATLGHALGREPKLEMLPMQPGDVERTWADTSALAADYGYAPTTPLPLGLARFSSWLRSYPLPDTKTST